MKDWLAMFSDDESQAILRMLECVVDHADEYRNEVHFLKGDGKVVFSVEPPGSKKTHNPGEISANSSLVTKMNRAELIEMLDPPPQRFDRLGRVRGGESNSFYFTETAKERYRKRNEVDDAAVRQAIGETLYQQYLTNNSGILELSVDDVSKALGIEPLRVRQQARILRDTGILNDIAPVNSEIEIGPVELTERGIHWSLASFPADLMASQPVRIAVNINIQNFVREIEAVPVSDTERQEAEELVKDLQKEPTTEKVARLMDMAANAQQLVPSVVRFFTENGQALTQYLSG